MKKNTLLSIAALLVLGLAGTSCKKNEDNPIVASNITKLTATLNGASEKPTSTTSTATGTFTGELNTSTRVLSYTVTYSGLTPTMGHLHRVTKADGTGGVEVPFPSVTNPIVAAAPLASQARVDSMLAGFYYANLHTTAYPGGEIRGDIKKQ